MKKFLMVGAMVLTGTLAMTGCSSVSKTYKTLNELAQKDYASISLSVTTTLDGETLRGTYTSKAASNGYSVEYSYEKLNSFEVDGDSITVPDEYKTTCSGSLTLVSGEITEQQGDPFVFETTLLTASKLYFQAEIFTDVKTDSKTTFSAKVTSIGSFCGKSLSVSDMTIEVKYAKKNLETIEITYKADGGAQVVLNYTFTL